eukprot:2853772-Ditylum_brightwellii.AAC.1
MVMPSQSKQEWGFGNKDPAIHDLCGKILWRCSWSQGNKPMAKGGAQHSARCDSRIKLCVLSSIPKSQ